MPEDPDLERRLEAMFSSTRPRHGFEDELWRRIEARRPWQRRLADAFRPAMRYAPALATILVVALGVTWLAGNHGAGSTRSTTSSSTGGAAYGNNQKAVAPGLGLLPPLASGADRSTAPQASSAAPETSGALAFNGTLPSLSQALPAYRYDEPSAAARDAAAAQLRARSGISVTVTPSNAATGEEPAYTATGSAPSGSQGGPTQTASAFLSGHGLTPGFAFQLSGVASGRQVVYQRTFDSPAGPIPQVRTGGSAAGLVVDLGDDLVSVRGPLDLLLTSALYQLRSAADALGAANVRQTTGAAPLDRAQVVYVLVVSRGHGYYEPELLLTGPGGAVLAPIVTPASLGG